LADGREGSAYVYDESAQVAPHDWDSDVFAGEELRAYVDRCAAWRRRYDAHAL
jgi:hypothetical protein